MKARSFAGILLVVVAGVVVAWLFRRGPEVSQFDAAKSGGSEQAFAQNVDSRGRIVPLVVNDGFSGAAFISAESPSDTAAEQPAYHVLRQPTIHRNSALDAVTTPPQLSSAFPHQLRLLGIQDAISEADAAGRDESSPANIPAQHRIADGDTLPQIAVKYYGDESRADEIYALNRERIPSFDLLPIGVEIDLPPI